MENTSIDWPSSEVEKKNTILNHFFHDKCIGWIPMYWYFIRVTLCYSNLFNHCCFCVFHHMSKCGETDRRQTTRTRREIILPILSYLFHLVRVGLLFWRCTTETGRNTNAGLKDRQNKQELRKETLELRRLEQTQCANWPLGPSRSHRRISTWLCKITETLLRHR